jgi:hypothetical protein
VTTVADATITAIFAPLARSDFKVQPAHTSNFRRLKDKKSSRPERDVHLRDPDFKRAFVQNKTAQTNNNSGADCIDDAQKSDQLAFFKKLTANIFGIAARKIGELTHSGRNFI